MYRYRFFVTVFLADGICVGPSLAEQDGFEYLEGGLDVMPCTAHGRKQPGAAPLSSKSKKRRGPLLDCLSIARPPEVLSNGLFQAGVLFMRQGAGAIAGAIPVACKPGQMGQLCEIPVRPSSAALFHTHTHHANARVLRTWKCGRTSKKILQVPCMNTSVRGYALDDVGRTTRRGIVMFEGLWVQEQGHKDMCACPFMHVRTCVMGQCHYSDDDEPS